MTRKKVIYGNWKMNQNLAEVRTFFNELSSFKPDWKCVAGIAPQFIHIPEVLSLAGSLNVRVGAQNASHKNSGAFTGDISPLSLTDMGVHFTLIGHSERRSIFKEEDELLNEKTKLALTHGLEVVFCIGETLEQRKSGNTFKVIETQLANGLKDLEKSSLKKIILAYEPVWAIGTGVTATPEQAGEVHTFIRNYLKEKTNFDSEETVILYGGSVKPDNVFELLSHADIDGALVGGASLKARDFADLCNEASKF